LLLLLLLLLLKGWLLRWWWVSTFGWRSHPRWLLLLGPLRKITTLVFPFVLIFLVVLAIRVAVVVVDSNERLDGGVDAVSRSLFGLFDSLLLNFHQSRHRSPQDGGVPRVPPRDAVSNRHGTLQQYFGTRRELLLLVWRENGRHFHGHEILSGGWRLVVGGARCGKEQGGSRSTVAVRVGEFEAAHCVAVTGIRTGRSIGTIGLLIQSLFRIHGNIHKFLDLHQQTKGFWQEGFAGFRRQRFSNRTAQLHGCSVRLTYCISSWLKGAHHIAQIVRQNLLPNGTRQRIDSSSMMQRTSVSLSSQRRHTVNQPVLGRRHACKLPQLFAHENQQGCIVVVVSRSHDRDTALQIIVRGSNAFSDGNWV